MREITRAQIGFADLELGRSVRLDPLRQRISDFLDRHGELVTAVHRDLSRALKHARRGRRGLSAEQVLRSFVLMRTKNWDYRELAERVADGFTLRQFTRFAGAPVPPHQAFHRAFVRLQAATLRKINDAVVDAAVKMGLEDVEKLRLDTTVVETAIRYPRDSGLLWDTVRGRGVTLVAIPQRGGKRSVEQEQFEKSRAFKQAQAFRSGVEGRISVLFRGRGMKRCLWSGSERFELFLAAAVLANNLLVIAARLQKRPAAASRRVAA